LTALDVSANTALTKLSVQANLFTAAALNALFGTLHSNPGEKTIYIRNNPRSGSVGSGTSDCDQNIAESRYWTVDTTVPY
jgi:hypothetical protein